MIAISFAPTAHAANKYLKKAEKAYADLEYDKVGPYLKKALRKTKDPQELARIHELSAIVHVMYGREAKAKKSFIQLLKKKPDYELPDDASPKVRAAFEAAQQGVAPKAPPAEKEETGEAADPVAEAAEAPPEEPAGEAAAEVVDGGSGETVDKKPADKTDKNCGKKKKKKKKRKKCPEEVSPSSDDIVRTGEPPIELDVTGDGPDASADGMSTDSEVIDAADGDASGMDADPGADGKLEGEAPVSKSLSEKVWMSTPPPRSSTPFYGSWWFWTIVGGAVAAGGATAGIILLTPPPQPTTNFGPVTLR